MRIPPIPRRAATLLITAAALSSCSAEPGGEPGGEPDPGASPPGATPEVPARAGFDLLVGFVDDRGNRMIYVDARGGTVRDLGRGVEPTWGPDGTTFAFVGVRDDEADVYLGDVRTGTRTRVGPGSSPTFSPDGRRLAFLRFGADGTSIVSVPVASPDSPPLLLYRDSQRDDVGSLRYVQGIDWSPNGASLVYTWSTSYDCGFWDGPTECPSPTGGLVVVDVANGTAREADRGFYIRGPRYSPDGRDIVANVADSGPRVVRADGSERPLQVPGRVWALDWSPDGASMLAAAYRLDGGTDLLSQSVATGASETLYSIDGNVLTVAWAR